MNGAKRAVAEADHTRRKQRIRPQARCEKQAPWADLFPPGCKVRIDEHASYTDRVGTVTRHSAYGVYVLLDMLPREFTVREPMIVAKYNGQGRPDGPPPLTRLP